MSKIKIFLDGIPEWIWWLLGLTVYGIILVVSASLMYSHFDYTFVHMLAVNCAISLIGVLGLVMLGFIVWGICWTVVEIHTRLKNYLYIVKNIPMIPTTYEDFNSLTANMSLTECLLWLDDKIACNNETYLYSGFTEKPKYANLVHDYFEFALEKYSDVKINEKAPKILYYDFYCSPQNERTIEDLLLRYNVLED